MAGILHFQGIETEKHAVFFHLGDGTLVRLDAGFGEELEKRLEVGLTGDVHSQLFAVLQKMFLHGRIDDMGVIAVAQQGFADGDGVFQRFFHENSSSGRAASREDPGIHAL